ncbi:MAG: ECF-type sigma factor [Acidobacteriota bacterium]|nr:ECF-type sigma factor [Acidobacteriota bacterium]
MSPGPEAISQLVTDAAQGTLVGPEQLVAAFYPELKRLAASRMRRESAGHTWQPTVLVHELFLELTRIRDLRPVHPANERERAAFFALASMVMTRLLIHHTRPRKWQAEKTGVPANLLDAAAPADQLAAIEGLLQRLAVIEPALRLVVELKVFGGFVNEEIAEHLSCSVRTVQRQWQFARTWLVAQIFGLPNAQPGGVAISASQ